MSDDDLLGRVFGRPPGRSVVRAADADREAVAALLRRAHGEGRLDTDELEQRLGRCYGARTLAELDRLVYDLPPAEQRGRRGAPRLPGLALLLPLALVALLVALGAHRHVLVVWPLLLVLVVRLGRGARRQASRRGTRW